MQKESRQAEGGGADSVRALFRGYKDQGRVITAEQSARTLVKILEGDPHRFHGKIATYNDA
jgi:hypothetical protein